MARYRLRFLLQEFDLAPGITLMGRATDCHVTIDDPLVSRHHARIVVEGDSAELHDLQSRNGVKLNGRKVRGPTQLRDGDRIRIGTQELVFCTLREGMFGVSAKTTGFLRNCAGCRTPYPQEAGQCPTCGCTEYQDDTLAGEFDPEARSSWNVQLLLEVLERALTRRSFDDAGRMVGRLIAQVDDQLSSEQSVQPAKLAPVIERVIVAGVLMGEPEWSLWGARVFQRMSVVPPVPVVEALRGAIAVHGDVLRVPIRELHVHASRLVVTDDDHTALDMLGSLDFG